MRVLVINSFSDLPEVGLYRGLKQRGVDIELILDPSHAKIEELRSDGIPVTPLRIRHRFDLFASSQVRRLLKERNFELIYTPSSRGLSVALLAGRSLCVRYVSYRGTMGHVSRWNPANFISHLNPRVDAIVCNCQAVRHYLLSVGIEERKLRTIYKGHDVSWYEPDCVLDRSEFGIPADAVLVGCLANFRPLKA